MSSQAKAFRLIHALALIPFAYALWQIPDFTGALNRLPPLLDWVALLVVFILAYQLTHSQKEQHWASYSYGILIVAWLLLGIGASLWLLLVGFALWSMNPRRPIPTPIQDALESIAIMGIGLMVSKFVWDALGASQHIADYTSPQAIISLAFALLIGKLISYAIFFLINGMSWRAFPNYLRQHLISEVIILAASAILPLVHQEVGRLAYLFLLGLIVIQIVRQERLSQTEYLLNRRLKDLAILKQLGQRISTNLNLNEVLDALHEELKQLVDLSSFFVAFYNDEHQVFEYPRLYVEDRLVEHFTRQVGAGVSEYVLKTRAPLLMTERNEARLRHLGIDPKLVSDLSFISLPLQVEDKIIGVMAVGNSKKTNAFDKRDLELLQTVASQASLALRNTTLYERTSQLAHNLAEINGSLQDVMFNLDKDDALLTACDIAIRVTQAQHAAIYLLQLNRDNRMERVQSMSQTSKPLPDFFPYRPDSFPEGSHVLTAKNSADADNFLDGFATCVQVLLRSGNTTIGALIVFHESDYFAEKPELNLLEMLANQITAALDNADLLQALELYAAEQAQLVHLSRISSANLDLELIIQDVCDMLHQMIRMSHIQVALYQIEQRTLQIYEPDASLARIQSQILPVNQIPEIANLLAGENYGSVQAYYPDQALSPELLQFMSLMHSQTLALIPMRINQQAMGMIILSDETEHLFSDNEFRLLEMAAHQIAAQLHNARIHMLTEEALIQRLEQLSLIEEIAQQISQSLDLDLIIDNVLDAALQATQAHLAAIALRTENADAIELIWKEVINGQIMRSSEHRFPFGGVVGRVMRSGETIVLADNSESQDYFRPTEVEYQSSLAVPLRKGEEIIGVINLESPMLNFFTSEHTSFIRSLAGHAAISIDNANLLEYRERQINVLTVLRSLSLETHELFDRQNVALAIVRAALILLEAQESSLYTLDARGGRLDCLSSVIRQQGTVNESNVFIPEALLADALEHNGIYAIENTHEHPFFEYTDHLSYGSIIIIPIHRRNMLSELLFIAFAEARKFSHDDKTALDSLAAQVASQLENAVLNEMIHTSNNRMRAILDANRDGIILLDTWGRIQDSNRAAETLLNVKLSEHFQASLSGLASRSGIMSQLLTAYQVNPEQLNGQEYVTGEGEQTIYLKTFVNPVQNTSGTVSGHLLILRDISEEKRLEIFRNKIQGMVMHDLRGPLSAIMTSMYLAINIIEFPGDKPLEESLIPTLEVSLDSANNLLNLVETLRDLPKIPQMTIEPQVTPLKEVAQEAVKSLSPNLTEANITIDYALDHAWYLHVDVDLTRRIFINLLHNAFKFTPENGTIQISASYDFEQEKYVRILVSDTGPGIPEDQRERIFGEFVQIEGRRPRAGGKGTGLGLNFCKLAVEAHGGRIWVEPNSPLSGACFAFTLPYYEGARPINDFEHEPPPLLED